VSSLNAIWWSIAIMPIYCKIINKCLVLHMRLLNGFWPIGHQPYDRRNVCEIGDSNWCSSFRLFGGQEIVINKSTLADVSQEPVGAVYNIPASNPGFLLEGGGALDDARSSEAQGNKLEYWGVGQLCNKYIDWPVDCFTPMCDGVPIEKMPGVRELRTRTVITTYGQRSDRGGTTGQLPTGLNYSFVQEFLE
jgi:hypothetical protein